MSRRMALLLVLLPVLSGCGLFFGKEGALPGDEPERRFPNTPYVASPQRAQQIISGYPKIKPGMTREEVKAVLGEPDEIRWGVDPLDWNRRSGSAYWYVLQRPAEKEVARGPETEILYVHFDREHFVKKVNFPIEPERRMEKYPYVAPQGRRDRILANYRRVWLGRPTNAKSLLGEPDEIVWTYGAENPHVPTGKLCRYVIRQRTRRPADDPEARYVEIEYRGSDEVIGVSSHPEGLSVDTPD